MAKKSKRRRKALRKARKASLPNPVAHNPETVSEASYGRTSAYLRSSCLDNAFQIPEEFETWQPYFWSRGAMLREWSRWLGAKLAGKIAKVETDMTPHHTLERKIKERRERNGYTGADFSTRLESIVNSLNLRAKPCDYRSAPRKIIVHHEPAITRPTGMNGESHLVV